MSVDQPHMEDLISSIDKGSEKPSYNHHPSLTRQLLEYQKIASTPTKMAAVLSINNFLLLITTLTISLMLPTNVNSATIFNFTTFPKDNPDLTLQGDANILSNEVLALTDHSNPLWNTGRALYAKPITIYDSSTGNLVSFQTTFTFVVDDLGSNGHADGLVFFMAPESDAKDIPSNSGGGKLGIVNGINAFNRFVAVEFDSYVNEWDPAFTHMGIDVNSLISLKTVRWDRKSGVLVYVSIVYDSVAKTLSVVKSEGGAITTVSHFVDLGAVLPDKVMIGLSATTTGSPNTELHDIHSWSFVVSSFEDERRSRKMIKNNIATYA